MFDPDALADEGGSSAFERQLRRAIERWVERPVLVIDRVPPMDEFVVPPEAFAVERPGAGPAAAMELCPAAQLLERGAGNLAAAREAQRREAREAAVQARELAAFARCRPADLLDRTDEEVGAAAAGSRAARSEPLVEISEWAVDEVMAALAVPAAAARRLLADAVTLVEDLPATLTALESGAITRAHSQVMTDLLGPLEPVARAEVEAQLLARVGRKTHTWLRQAARRAVLRVDAAAAARRLAQAVRERRVGTWSGDDGMATLAVTLPEPVIAACRRALRGYAEQCAVPGDSRTLDQRMADCLVDLLLRPGASGGPPVTVRLDVVASVGTLTGGDEPGEIDGQPVPAQLVRELAYALDLLPRPTVVSGAAQTATDCSAAERGVDAETARPMADPASESAQADLADLLTARTVAGTALAAVPTVAVVEAISGQRLALTDAAEIRRVATCGRRACRTGTAPCTHPPTGPGLGPPEPSPGYRPGARLDRFVRARDRRCRFPGCRARPMRCDLDHACPWPVGPTSHGNLCCLCRHHHRLSHQAPGWAMGLLPDGGLEWALPGGERLTTYPPRYGADDDLPPTRAGTVSAAHDLPPPLEIAERVLGRPAPPASQADDSPPF